MFFCKLIVFVSNVNIVGVCLCVNGAKLIFYFVSQKVTGNSFMSVFKSVHCSVWLVVLFIVLLIKNHGDK